MHTPPGPILGNVPILGTPLLERDIRSAPLDLRTGHLMHAGEIGRSQESRFRILIAHSDPVAC